MYEGKLGSRKMDDTHPHCPASCVLCGPLGDLWARGAVVRVLCCCVFFWFFLMRLYRALRGYSCGSRGFLRGPDDGHNPREGATSSTGGVSASRELEKLGGHGDPEMVVEAL